MPSTSGLGWEGILFVKRLALDLINKIDNLPNRCLMTSPSSWPVDLPKAWPSLLSSTEASLLQPPSVSHARAWKAMPSAWQAMPYFFHFSRLRCFEAKPGSIAARSTYWAWSGLTMHTSRHACRPPMKWGMRTSAGLLPPSTPGRSAASSRRGARDALWAVWKIASLM